MASDTNRLLQFQISYHTFDDARLFSKMKLLLVLAISASCLVGVILCGPTECANPGLGRVIAVRNKCNSNETAADAATCTVELDWIPAVGHEILNARLKVLKNEAWNIIRDGPIPDVKFTTDMQYTSEIIIDRKELPTPPEIKVELYQPEIVEVCRLAKEFSS